MRLQGIILTAAAVATSAMAASREAAFVKVNTSDAERLAIGYGSPERKVALYIWSDKYVYQAGQALTVKWTVKTNNDLYPYTVVAFRQNNQDGKKYYLPGGTEAVTDTAGNTAAQGFQPVQLQNAAKATLIGAGGTFPAVTIPNELGMHTIVVQLRDYTGTRVLKAAYAKISVVSETVNVSGEITSDTTWVNTKSYNLNGIVPVKNNATLTVEPGTIVTGTPGSQPASVLLVTRNGKIVAAGTKSRPIIFTSSRPFGERQRGDWGGVLMLGKAPINVGANIGTNNNQSGEFYIEGLNTTPDGLYGGSDPNHNCGTMTYVRIEYSGTILSPNNETNSFTWAGCGKGTVAHHLQAIYGADDSFEWFGGNADAKYLVGGLSADDYVDFQLGWTGRLQYGVFYQSPDSRGNRGIEGDNSEYNQSAEPSSNPSLYNLTFIGSGQSGFDEANSPGIFLRRGARATINNSVVTNFFSGALDFNDANTQAQLDAGNITMNGTLIWANNLSTNSAATLPGQITNAAALAFAQGARGAGKGVNFLVANPGLLRPSEYSDPDFRGIFGSPIFRAGWVSPPDDGFFDQSARFIGGIGDEDWMEEWTSFLIDTDLI